MSTIEDSKQISMKGTNNRYQMKKVLKQQEKNKVRKEVKKWILEPIDYTYEKQMEILLQEENKKLYSLLIQQIERKIGGYKQQDLEKGVYQESEFVKLEEVLSNFIKEKGKCFYCDSELLLLYERVREPKQWTLDRLDNDLGHNINNVVFSCLDCNLKKKCKSKEKFLFTKQLVIVKEK